MSFVDGYPTNLHKAEMQRLIRGDDATLPATLVRDPGNPHDGNAIRVEISSLTPPHVGHIPAKLAARLAPLMDSGHPVDAWVDKVLIVDKYDDRPGLLLGFETLERLPKAPPPCDVPRGNPRRVPREEILSAVNAWRRERGYCPAPLTMRHIQQAVCIARRQCLVDARLLDAAGYRAKARR